MSDNDEKSIVKKTAFILFIPPPNHFIVSGILHT